MAKGLTLKLKPYLSKKIWGWEKWVLSCHEEGNSTIEEGIYEGQKLSSVLGCGSNFPILNKIIKAEATLSVQVHPNDDYAKRIENANGKTECWYILEAKEGATLVSGIKRGLNKEKLREIIREGKLEDYLERINIKRGDFIYIPAGTVHAIEAGVKLIEVQQNSNITYRLHDWGRGRELHIEKSLDVIDYGDKNKAGKINKFDKLDTPYFKVEKVIVHNNYMDVVNESFHSYIVTSGEGVIKANNVQMKLKEEETIYISKGTEYILKGNMELIKSSL
ncbi:class I mannose-6-phosphate isomerase [Clostridium tagluense]|uniref:type I phosphomannose isomerase catalytic subunit n=1 Tax=Clostridium tagluense TaxID=360422 RepID=UPI001C0DDE53|nr:type I phosphomannose isomerase catalytic subunit [Clostridium tagluense]MBU3127798.1 class I mannose-6-phosphate isomerase [Clostridium tagluense]MCB2310178.1 class I mannose-6-phosphate isomerase [Clostridium tagluense]MCB2315180.1 class I mannose-6-phosphate isomerase [Clostridium tagluense]MCB2319878.1 class I mannose-6-phosphate isomerase [Clostridium tagluense]MCB2324923.1 class I mannose-6-phosphate isomerase [Clostridium tagluense]